jgi:hypothetical protein
LNRVSVSLNSEKIINKRHCERTGTYGLIITAGLRDPISFFLVSNIGATETALNKASQEAGTSPKQLKQPKEQTERKISALIFGRFGPYTATSSNMKNSASTYTALNASSTKTGGNRGLGQITPPNH